MRILLSAFMIVSLILTGCANNEEIGSQRDLDPEPVRINTGDNKQVVIDKRPARDYIQSDEEGVGRYGTERNIFNSREERQISQALARRPEVVQSRVAVTPNRVVAFVSLKDYPTGIKERLREDVGQFVDEKEIIIFTDEAQWERMKQLESGLGAKEIGEDVEGFLERHFNLDIKDD